jgi:hypothetical protein
MQSAEQRDLGHPRPSKNGCVTPCHPSTTVVSSNTTMNNIKVKVLSTVTETSLAARRKLMSLSGSAEDQHLHQFTIERIGALARCRIAFDALEHDALLALATSSFTSDLLCKLYQTDECVIEVDCISDWLTRSVTWVVDGAEPVGLLGLLSIAPWTQVGLKLGDDNLLEIGLLASERSACGRLLLALALRECDEQGKDGICLELLGGKANKPAFALYTEFGFVHEPRLEADSGRHLRNEHKDLLFYMTLRRASPAVPLFTMDVLQKALRRE